MNQESKRRRDPERVDCSAEERESDWGRRMTVMVSVRRSEWPSSSGWGSETACSDRVWL
jgi:hypothetical protein